MRPPILLADRPPDSQWTVQGGFISSVLLLLRKEAAIQHVPGGSALLRWTYAILSRCGEPCRGSGAGNGGEHIRRGLAEARRHPRGLGAVRLAGIGWLNGSADCWNSTGWLRTVAAGLLEPATG